MRAGDSQTALKLHPKAAHFKNSAAEYEAGRPTYPTEAIEKIAKILQLCPGRKVLELGAGTGKMTQQLAAFGTDIIALEPIGEMASLLKVNVPTATVLNTVVQDLALPDSSVSSVIAAQAFHWFSDSVSIGQILRVLQKDGVLCLIWNIREENVAWMQEISQLLDFAAEDTPRYKTCDWRTAL